MCIYCTSAPIDELRGVRRRPRFVRIDTAFGGQIPYFRPPSAASMRTNRGRRLTPPNSSIGAWAYRRNLMSLTSSQTQNAFVYKRMCLRVDVECHHEQMLHTLRSVQDVYTTYTCTMNRVQLCSTDEICSTSGTHPALPDI